jgi:tRNA (guanine10-N2)-methyltransferase
MGWYLCYFLHRHLDFRRAEVQALADLAGCGAEVRWRAPHGDVEHSPLWHVWLPSDAAAREICERSVLVKAFVELWGEGDGPDALCASIASFPAARKDPFLAPDTTFKVELEDFGWTEHGTRGDNWAPVVRRMDALAPAVTFLGKARMKDPQHVFWSVETAREGQWKGLPSDIPPRNYFGRVVAKGLGRACIKTYDLTKRRYLGPTSMDVEMGLIMCNMAHARPGGVVWDPFCGTGSILIAAAHFGAMTLGSDIDIRVIKHGKRDKKTGKQVDVWTNFEDYGLPPPVGLVRMDLHKHSFKRDPAAEATTGERTSSAAGDVGGSSSGLARGPSVARLEGSLQAVVGDPPYGVRAGGSEVRGSETPPGRHRRADSRGAPLGPHPEHGAVSLLGVPRRPHGPEREAPRGRAGGCASSRPRQRARRTRPPPARTRSRATRAWS